MAVAVGSGDAKPPTTITTTCAKLRIKMRPIMEEGYEKKKNTECRKQLTIKQGVQIITLSPSNRTTLIVSPLTYVIYTGVDYSIYRSNLFKTTYRGRYTHYKDKN